MKYLPILIIIIIKLSKSDNDKAGQKGLENLEKKAKALACSFLSNTFISSTKDYDKKFRDILKENNFIQNESEAKEKISQFMLVNCYLKITSEIANKLIMNISTKKIDVKNKEYLSLFEMDKNTDFKKMSDTMKEINGIMKEIKAEEEIFAKKRKEDPNFEKNLKDFEEKMKKNYEQKKTEKNKNSNVKNTKKKKGTGKKPYEGTKWEIVQSNEEKLLNFTDIILNPQIFFEVTGLNTVCGMIILTLVIINIFKIASDIKNKKNDIKEQVEKVNEEEEINEINRENNDDNVDGEEETEELNNNKDNENINNLIEKENKDDNIIEENNNVIEEDKKK